MALWGGNSEDQKGDMSVSWGYENKYPQRGQLQHQNLFSHHAGGSKSQFKMCVLTFETFSLASRMLSFFLGLYTSKFLPCPVVLKNIATLYCFHINDCILF